MGNRLYIQIKVGTKVHPVRQMSFLDGMLVTYTDELDLGGIDVIFGEQSKKAFAILEVDRNYKPLLVDYMNALDETPLLVDVPATYRQRKGVFVLDDFKALISSDIVDRWRSAESVPVIDGRAFRLEQLIRNAKDFDPSVFKFDRNAYTSGDWTIGTAGQDYSDWVATAADEGATLTGNASLTQETDVTNTTGPIFNVALAGYTYTFTTDTPHLGNQANGRITTQQGTGNGININCSGNGTINVSNLHINRTVNAVNKVRFNMLLNHGAGTVTINAQDLLMRAASGIQGTGLYLGGCTTGNADNILSYGFNGTTGDGVLIANANWKVENMVIRGCIDNGLDCGSVACEVNNSYVHDNGADIVNHASTTGDSNATGDSTGTDTNWGTGTNNNPSLTTANEIISSDPTNAEFVRPKSGGTIYNSGAAPDHANDIAGVAWATPPSIGVFQFVAAAVGPPLGSLSLLGVGR